jgi:hypothetical protein
MRDSALVPIETFVNRIEAELARGALTAAGIDAVVSNDDAGGVYASAMRPGSRLLVREEDVERATQILSQTAELDPEE